MTGCEFMPDRMTLSATRNPDTGQVTPGVAFQWNIKPTRVVASKP